MNKKALFKFITSKCDECKGNGEIEKEKCPWCIRNNKVEEFSSNQRGTEKYYSETYIRNA